MKTIWNDGDYRELRGRVANLRPDAPAKWGKFTAPQMVCHLADALRMASGELPVAPKNLPIRFTPIKQLIIYWLPFPKGAPTAPQLLARKPAEWAAEVQDLHRELDAIVTRGPAGPWLPHPAFGDLSPKAWGVLIYRHTDHHLKQFGA
jgi:hypothetical protein